MGLCETVDVVVRLTWVDKLVMGDIIDIVFIQEFLVYHPRGIWNHLVDPSTLSDCLASLGVSHGGCGFVAGT